MAVRKQETLEELLLQLTRLSPESLAVDLKDDTHKLTFWINCYNAFIQVKIKEQGAKPSTTGKFFTKRSLLIAGQKLSFDDIEHGIIRGGRAKYGLGWIPSLWRGRFLKEQSVKQPDWRIHFALNCGAKSCPPVVFYTVKYLNEDLETASKGYLENDTSYDESTNTAHVTKLMFWFMGDFKGKKGIQNILEQYELTPKGSKPKIKFKNYDWETVIDNYSGSW